MILSQMITALRIELQDRDTDSLFHSKDDLARAIDKSVALMSRLIPKRTMVETSIGGAITGETLTISSNTGTLAYKPVKVDSLSIEGKTLHTDYTVNYLTGVVTEVGSGLPDTDYTVSYELDPRIINLSSLVPDYIKIERVEYPAGQDPPTNPTFDLIGDYLLVRGNKVTLAEDKQLRVIYLAEWTPPDDNGEGDFPNHLNNAVVIGSAGQALIFKAEKYVKEAVDVLTTITPPTAPTAPTLSFTDVGTALIAVGTRITAGAGYLTTGTDKINAATRGHEVGKTYGAYGDIEGNLAGAYVSQAIAYLREEEAKLTKYASEVTVFGSETNLHTAQVNDQGMKARNFLDIASRYLASGQAKIQEMLIMLGTKIEFPTTKALPAQRE